MRCLTLLRARRRGKTMVLLEHTAGQGTVLGSTFEQLASIIAKMNDHRSRRRLPRYVPPDRVGLRPVLRGGLRAHFTQFGRLVGFERLKAFHLNDSKKPLGSRVDRHEHIGQGHLGLEPFRRIVNDRAVSRPADAARNAERRRQGHGPDRRGSAR